MKKLIISVCVSVICGILAGGYLFSDTQSRSFLALNKCENNCLNYQELTGLKSVEYEPESSLETKK